MKTKRSVAIIGRPGDVRVSMETTGIILLSIDTAHFTPYYPRCLPTPKGDRTAARDPAMDGARSTVSLPPKASMAAHCLAGRRRPHHKLLELFRPVCWRASQSFKAVATADRIRRVK